MNQYFSFLLGVLISLSLSMTLFYPQKLIAILSSDNSKVSDEIQSIPVNLYNETLSKKLYNEVRILCWVLTNPKSHRTKAIYVKQTWGSRCNKLLFMSTETDMELGTVALPVKEGRATLWDKTKSALQYIYKNHFNDAEWFLKADDDK